jgi:hypothetical protein
VGRVKKALAAMHTDREAKRKFRNRFVATAVESAFAALNRKQDWEAFYNHDLPLIVSLAVCPLAEPGDLPAKWAEAFLVALAGA